jgi:hypothetical protein
MTKNKLKSMSILEIPDTSYYLGINELNLRKRIHLSQVSGLIRLGRRLYFDRPKLEKFIDELTIDSRYKKTHNWRYADEKN